MIPSPPLEGPYDLYVCGQGSDYFIEVENTYWDLVYATVLVARKYNNLAVNHLFVHKASGRKFEYQDIQFGGYREITSGFVIVQHLKTGAPT